MLQEFSLSSQKLRIHLSFVISLSQEGLFQPKGHFVIIHISPFLWKRRLKEKKITLLTTTEHWDQHCSYHNIIGINPKDKLLLGVWEGNDYLISWPKPESATLAFSVEYT